MNTKFNMKQLLSVGTILLVVSLGARCGYSDDDVARAQARAREEGVSEARKMNMDRDAEFAKISVDYAQVELDDFVNGLKFPSRGDVELAIRSVDKKELTEKAQKCRDIKKSGGWVGYDKDGGLLKRLAFILVKEGTKAKDDGTEGKVVLHGETGGEELRMGIGKMFLSAVKYILTPAIFSKGTIIFEGTMKPELRASMFMALLESIKGSGLNEKLVSVVEAQSELYKLCDGLNELPKQVDEIKKVFDKLKNCFVIFKEAVDSYDTASDASIYRYTLKNGTLNRGNAVIELTPVTKHGKERTDTKKSNPRGDLNSALEHVKNAYALAVGATEKLIREYEISIGISERKLAQEQEVERRAAAASDAAEPAGAGAGTEPGGAGARPVGEPAGAESAAGVTESKTDGAGETQAAAATGPAAGAGTEMRDPRPAGGWLVAGTESDKIGDAFSGPEFNAFDVADVRPARNRTEREYAEMKISVERKAGRGVESRTTVETEAAATPSAVRPSRRQVLDKVAMRVSAERRAAAVAQRKQVAAEREAAEGEAAEGEAARVAEGLAAEREGDSGDRPAAVAGANRLSPGQGDKDTGGGEQSDTDRKRLAFVAGLQKWAAGFGHGKRQAKEEKDTKEAAEREASRRQAAEKQATGGSADGGTTATNIGLDVGTIYSGNVDNAAAAAALAALAAIATADAVAAGDATAASTAYAATRDARDAACAAYNAARDAAAAAADAAAADAAAAAAAAAAAGISYKAACASYKAAFASYSAAFLSSVD